MNIVIPMAGEGLRFRKAGYKIPKWMIHARNRTLLEWSLASLPTDIAKKIIFIPLESHLDNYPLLKYIQDICKNRKYEILPLKCATRGQAQTVLYVRELIDNDEPLAIYNIDTYFKSKTLKGNITSAKKRGIDGIIGAFNGSGNRWSYARCDKNGFVKETTEKEPISNIALTGLYHFTKGSDYVYAALKMIENNLLVKNEFYVAPVYNILINEGKKYIVDFVDEFWCLGTPEDLEYFNKNFRGRR